MEQIILYSEKIDAIAPAMVKFQGECEPAKTTSANPFFKSKYSDLAEVWGTVRPHLLSNGLSVIQGASVTGKTVGVETLLLHSSGQWFKFSLTLPCEKDTPQAIGSCITYGRRYGICAILGVSQEDDDGNAGSAPKKEPEPKPEPAKKTTNPPMKKPSASDMVKSIQGIKDIKRVMDAQKYALSAGYDTKDLSIIQVAITSTIAQLEAEKDLPFLTPPEGEGK
jgi:hypothetical protein